MKLTDIIGQIHGIGVENLRGSGMIAGEQSAAYDQAFYLVVHLRSICWNRCVLEQIRPKKHPNEERSDDFNRLFGLEQVAR